MKDVKDMTREELLVYCTKKKLNGFSNREFLYFFDNNGINSETRKYIMERLSSLDKQQKIQANKVEKSNNKKSGIITLIIGISIIFFGFILYISSAKAGVIFIFNFIVWGFGSLLTLRGIVSIIAGYVKK